MDAKGPDKPLTGKVLTLMAFGRDTFVDFDLEVNPAVVRFQRESMLRHCLASLGDVEAAVRSAKTLPPAGRDAALSQIVANLAGRGDVSRAMDLATSIESADARLSAFVMLAFAIPGGQARN